MGFLNMTDRMVWPPSLSRDRKVNTHSRVVCLRLKGNLVYSYYFTVESNLRCVTASGHICWSLHALHCVSYTLMCILFNF